MVATLKVNYRGIEPVLRTYKSLIPKLAETQRIAGFRVGNTLKQEARAIIRQKAPKSSGRLANSLFVQQEMLSRGWKTKVSSNAHYAWKVESGHPQENRPATPELLQWVDNVLGPKAKEAVRRKGSMIVRRGRNPYYDTSQGMKFFQTPIERNRGNIDDVYREEVRKVLNNIR